MYIISFNFEELLKCKYKLKNRMDKTGIAFARLRSNPRSQPCETGDCSGVVGPLTVRGLS